MNTRSQGAPLKTIQGNWPDKSLHQIHSIGRRDKTFFFPALNSPEIKGLELLQEATLTAIFGEQTPCFMGAILS